MKRKHITKQKLRRHTHNRRMRKDASMTPKKHWIRGRVRIVSGKGKNKLKTPKGQRKKILPFYKQGL